MTHPCTSNPDRWFSEIPAEVAQAKKACTHCPARGECAVLGEDEQFGVWGGMSPDDRRDAKRRRLIFFEERLNARIRTLRTEGMSISAMARELDMPRKTLADRLHRMIAA